MLTKSVLRGIAAVAMLVGFATPGLAIKPKLLRAPAGLAVDGQGNLYVANAGGNNILVYGPDFTQQTASTITKGIANPIAVQFDVAGNLWISNFDHSDGGATGSVIEYSDGVLQTAHTIRAVDGPLSIAFDGNDNLWVQNGGNGQNNVEVFIPRAAYAPPSLLVKTISPPNGVTSVSVWAGVVATSQGTNVCFASASVAMRGSNTGAICDFLNSSTSAAVFAPDNAGHLYVATNDANQDVYFHQPNNTFFGFTNLTVPAATGMAVDDVNQRLYVSSASTNQIFVYSTASATSGQLLTTLHN